MHELAITQSMFDIVLKYAQQAQAKKVVKINLVIGEMTGVVSDCVQFYLDLLSKDTIAEGAMVSVTMVPPEAKCRNCHQTFEVKQFDWTCTHCGASSLDIVAGKELFVESIEVD
jgi:hydrogenase nickel incorporation protein HypA/HybF